MFEFEYSGGKGQETPPRNNGSDPTKMNETFGEMYLETMANDLGLIQNPFELRYGTLRLNPYAHPRSDIQLFPYVEVGLTKVSLNDQSAKWSIQSLFWRHRS